MILNVTNKSVSYFTSARRWALRGEPLVCHHVTSIEDFYVIYAKLKNVKAVIVDKDDFILVNDICNAVPCPVLTLDVETFDCITNSKFIPYE
jgi:hypothetical protein